MTRPPTKIKQERREKREERERERREEEVWLNGSKRSHQ